MPQTALNTKNSNTLFLVVAAVVVLSAVAFAAFSLGRRSQDAGVAVAPTAARVAAGNTADSVTPDGVAPAGTKTPRPKQPTPAVKPTLNAIKQAEAEQQAYKKEGAATQSPPAAKAGTSLVMRDQRIYALDGSLAYEGDIDLQPTFDRIAAGKKDRHRNDGSTFGNREGLLPRKPRGYYTEWVIRTKGLSDVGPQRLITGRDGEAYYTPDHYVTFVRVK